jgi:hypothetical protein
LEPRPKQNGFPPKLAAHESLVKELVEQFPDATLKELTDTLAQKGDIQVQQFLTPYITIDSV